MTLPTTGNAAFDQAIKDVSLFLADAGKLSSLKAALHSSETTVGQMRDVLPLEIMFVLQDLDDNGAIESPAVIDDFGVPNEVKAVMRRLVTECGEAMRHPLSVGLLLTTKLSQAPGWMQAFNRQKQVVDEAERLSEQWPDRLPLRVVNSTPVYLGSERLAPFLRVTVLAPGDHVVFAHLLSWNDVAFLAAALTNQLHKYIAKSRDLHKAGALDVNIGRIEERQRQIEKHVKETLSEIASWSRDGDAAASDL